jgi:hypothetical protein
MKVTELSDTIEALFLCNKRASGDCNFVSVERETGADTARGKSADICRWTAIAS